MKLFVVVFCSFILHIGGQIHEASVLFDGNKYVVVDGIQPNSIAFATFNVSYTENGWNTLVVTTSEDKSYNDTDKHYAAGYVEGALTYEYIYYSYHNSFLDEFMNVTFDIGGTEIMAYINANVQWIRAQVQSKSSYDPYWYEVSLVMAQLDGMMAGIESIAPSWMELDITKLILINYDGDLADIIPGTIFDSTFQFPTKRKTHCSALIRHTQDELFCAHTTWDSFITMTRIFKRYIFPSSTSNVAADHVLFSSYPGALSSIDDFYMLNSGLYVSETTITNFDLLLYEFLTPESVPSWIRVIVANRLSNTTQDWCSNFGEYNSGTYNNQWMVVDHKLYEPGMTELVNNTIWILEQIPGYVQSADVTGIVNSQGYWGSYNVPYFEDIYIVMGYPLAAEADAEASHNCSRSKIFKRDANKVMDLEGMKSFMQYNEWETDPASEGDACKSISARCDLSTKFDSSADGGIDSKIASHQMMKEMVAVAISGPTHETQVPFTWSSEWSGGATVLGQPTTFDFDWVTMDF